ATPVSCTAPSTSTLCTLSLHDALPISLRAGTSLRKHAESGQSRRLFSQSLRAISLLWGGPLCLGPRVPASRQGRRCKGRVGTVRSEEHTSELQSPYDLVCRLLLEKKKK